MRIFSTAIRLIHVVNKNDELYPVARKTLEKLVKKITNQEQAFYVPSRPTSRSHIVNNGWPWEPANMMWTSIDSRHSYPSALPTPSQRSPTAERASQLNTQIGIA